MTKFKMNGFSRYTKEDAWLDGLIGEDEAYCEETGEVVKLKREYKWDDYEELEELHEEENAWLDEWLD